MPRNRDDDNDSRRGRDDRAPRQGRSGKPRGPEKKFAKRGVGGKDEGDKRPFAGKREARPFRSRDDGDKPRRAYGDKPRFDRDDRAPRGRDEGRPAARFSDRKFGDKRPSAARDGEKRPYAPRGERPERKFGDDRKLSRGGPDRGPRKEFGDRGPRKEFGDRGPRKEFGDRGPRKEFGDRGPRKEFGDRGPRKEFGDRGPRKEFGDRGPRKEFGDRGPRKTFGDRDRGDQKPWQKREAGPREDRGGDERPRFSRPREERVSGDRPFRERPKFDRPREDRPKFDRPRRDRDGGPGDRGGDRPKFDRPRQRPEGRTDWQEHPRSERRFSDRPRRDNEDDSKVFAKRPAFGGRGAYRERRDDFERRPPREDVKPKKVGERIAKALARAGLASRRDAEEMVTQGRVTVNGRVINSPALDITPNDVVTVDGKPLPPRERTRLFLYHKPRGLMTTHDDPEGRPTVFDNLPEGLPRLISIGRLDFNTEGLLLLTNDGGLARVLELPDTGWLRRYRVRAHGEITQAQLDQLANGIEVDGVKYGPMEATLERDQGANVWLVVAIREGKNREVRNVLAHLGLEVNRLIRVSYGPFQLGEIAEGEVQEIKSRVLREQLGDKVIAQAGAQFDVPAKPEPRDEGGVEREKKLFKPAGKSALINDRKGRRVLVQRTGSDEARERNELEAGGYGPPRRPKRGYHGKRDLTPRDE